MAAAMPPSAITVCALPSSDLVMIAVFAPASAAAIAARRPEPPAPITMTSYWCRSAVPCAGADVVSVIQRPPQKNRGSSNTPAASRKM